jgi:Neuraminidase (sialidase)
MSRGNTVNAAATIKIMLLSVLLLWTLWPMPQALACHDTAQGRPACPTLAVRANEQIYVVYINLNPRDIFFTRSLDGGDTWSTPINLSANPGDSVRPTIALSPEGVIYVAWGDDTEGQYDVFLRYSTDTGNTWSPERNITAQVKRQNRLPSIAVDANGTLYAAWAHKERHKDGDVVTVAREVFLQYSPDGGETWSTPYGVSRGPSLSAIVRPELTLDPIGNLYVIWEEEDSGNFEIYLSRGTHP